MKHRKLFPALTAQNQTTDCPNYSCDPVICPYNCYSDYYYFPPPPPHPPPPPISSQEPHRLPPFLIVVISLLASFFLLLGYYVIVVKRRNNRQPPAEAEDAEAEEGLDHNRIDHPIWFITTIGLQQSVINSITVCRYKKGEGLIEGTDCSVCLSEFQEDETLRLLPKCNHAFHISCIDTWLRTHTNCPLCRARIVHDDPVGSPPPPPPVSQNPDSLDSIARTQMVNSPTDGGLSNNQERNEACENRGETEQVTSEGVKNEINVPIRRSFSMDSVMAANLCLESEMGSDPANILEREERDSSTIRPTGSSSIVQCLTTSPISMRRSFSCGGRFFSSRHNRSVNSIVPR